MHPKTIDFISRHRRNHDALFSAASDRVQALITRVIKVAPIPPAAPVWLDTSNVPDYVPHGVEMKRHRWRTKKVEYGFSSRVKP